MDIKIFMELEKVSEILRSLEEHYIDYKIGLDFKTPFELLVATILSAQCTDVQVNKTTSKLFLKYNTAAAFAELQYEELQKEIKSCGFYKVKSFNIIETSKILVKEYNGKVPRDLEKLIKLPGVGRKTANVVLSNAFGIDAIAVDTHVFRVSARLGLAKSNTPYATEEILMGVIPKDLWAKAHHWLIWHGRELCLARKPKCRECFLNLCCDYFIH